MGGGLGQLRATSQAWPLVSVLTGLGAGRENPQLLDWSSATLSTASASGYPDPARVGGARRSGPSRQAGH